MIKIILPLSMFAAMTASQCSTDSGSINSTNVCKNVPTFDKTLGEMSAEQPYYFFILPNRPQIIALDNVCFTMFPALDGDDEYIIYSSFVYSNGSTAIETYSAINNGTGISVWSNPDRTFSFHNLACVGCGSFAVYGCPLFGDTTERVCVIGPGLVDSCVGNGTGKLRTACVEKAKLTAFVSGLESLDDFYVLPYNLPTRCVTRQRCLAEGNPLYCQQDGRCQAYESSLPTTC